MVLKNVCKFSPLLELLKRDIRHRVAYRVPKIIGTRIDTPIGTASKPWYFYVFYYRFQ